MIYWSQARAAVAFPMILFFAACTASQSGTVQAGDSAAPGTLTADQRAAGWRLLVDGSNVGAWRGYKTQTMPAGWTAANGTLTKSTVTG